MLQLPDHIRSKIIKSDETDLGLLNNSRKNKTLVFTNGCFDILHQGHLHLLSRAKEMGNLLIVGLNTDDSVSRLKGPDRPVKDELTRAYLLASLEMVDFVILFSEDTPANLIKVINPDILVKGSDYSEDEIAGASFVKSKGGKIVTIPLLEGFSSTSLIEKSKKQ